MRTATTEPNAVPESFQGPKLVYFWGPIREHVNRIALEYARRLNRHPVRLDIPGGREVPFSVEARGDGGGITLYALEPRGDVRPGPSLDATQPLVTDSSAPLSLPKETGQYLRYRTIVRTALQSLATRKGPSVFVITNIDLLGHVGLLTDFGRSSALLKTMEDRDITVVVTSKGLIRAPRLPTECAFRVESDDADRWLDADLWPGVPDSCCTKCAGSPSGENATCSPHLRSACPLRIPFSFMGVAESASVERT